MEKVKQFLEALKNDPKFAELMDREQPKTALMLSFGSQIFSRSQWSGWGQAPANTILNLFWKAHIPTAVLTEEGVRNGELARYDRILLYRTSHLPQDVFDRFSPNRIPRGPN